jgi:hypothetical protein
MKLEIPSEKFRSCQETKRYSVRNLEAVRKL